VRTSVVYTDLSHDLQRIASLFSTLYTTTTSHPILALLAVVASWVVLWRALKKSFAGGESMVGVGAGGGYQSLRGPKRE
jgi:hypothetical protein